MLSDFLSYLGFAAICLVQAQGPVIFPEVSSGVIH